LVGTKKKKVSFYSEPEEGVVNAVNEIKALLGKINAQDYKFTLSDEQVALVKLMQENCKVYYKDIVDLFACVNGVNIDRAIITRNLTIASSGNGFKLNNATLQFDKTKKPYEKYSEHLSKKTTSFDLAKKYISEVNSLLKGNSTYQSNSLILDNAVKELNKEKPDHAVQLPEGVESYIKKLNHEISEFDKVLESSLGVLSNLEARKLEEEEESRFISKVNKQKKRTEEQKRIQLEQAQKALDKWREGRKKSNEVCGESKDERPGLYDLYIKNIGPILSEDQLNARIKSLNFFAKKTLTAQEKLDIAMSTVCALNFYRPENENNMEKFDELSKSIVSFLGEEGWDGAKDTLSIKLIKAQLASISLNIACEQCDIDDYHITFLSRRDNHGGHEDVVVQGNNIEEKQENIRKRFENIKLLKKRQKELNQCIEGINSAYVNVVAEEITLDDTIVSSVILSIEEFDSAYKNSDALLGRFDQENEKVIKIQDEFKIRLDRGLIPKSKKKQERSDQAELYQAIKPHIQSEKYREIDPKREVAFLALQRSMDYKDVVRPQSHKKGDAASFTPKTGSKETPDDWKPVAHRYRVVANRSEEYNDFIKIPVKKVDVVEKNVVVYSKVEVPELVVINDGGGELEYTVFRVGSICSLLKNNEVESICLTQNSADVTDYSVYYDKGGSGDPYILMPLSKLERKHTPSCEFNSVDMRVEPLGRGSRSLSI